jgi:hypothetical protein
MVVAAEAALVQGLPRVPLCSRRLPRSQGNPTCAPRPLRCAPAGSDALVARIAMPPGHFCGEAVFVPRREGPPQGPQDEDDGCAPACLLVPAAARLCPPLRPARPSPKGRAAQAPSSARPPASSPARLCPPHPPTHPPAPPAPPPTCPTTHLQLPGDVRARRGLGQHRPQHLRRAHHGRAAAGLGGAAAARALRLPRPVGARGPAAPAAAAAAAAVSWAAAGRSGGGAGGGLVPQQQLVARREVGWGC